MPKPNPEIDALIRQMAAKYKIPYELLYAQVQQESAFNPLAVSHCGARGLMQIMPLTWRDITGRDAEVNSNIFDPVKNLDAGARYVLRMYKTCKRMITTMPANAQNECTDDDYWKLALAGYNGGLGYIIRAINILFYDQHPINWENLAPHLADPRVVVHGKNPDEKQMTDYVAKIWGHYKGNNHV